MIMFGSLKKKLMKGVEKLSSVISRSEEAPKTEKISEPVAEELRQEEIEEKIGQEEETVIEPQMPQEPKEPIILPEEERVSDILEKPAIKEVKKEEKAPEPQKKEEKKPEKEKKERKEGLFSKIKRKVTEKTVAEGDIEETLKDIELGLLENDVALEVSEKILKDLKSNIIGKNIPRGEIEKAVTDSIRSSLLDIFKYDKKDISALLKSHKPLKIIFLGFNGTGKTTTIAKLAYEMKKQNLSIILAAGDTFRAASIEQLEEHGSRLGIPVIKQKYGSDSAAVIFDAVKAAEARGCDVVLADTAGRSHSNLNLMDEIKKVIRVNKPDLKILVVDCLTGNDAVEQAKKFDEAVGVDGIIMTKADVYDKGGAVLSATFAIKKPILYIGIGQGYGSLKKFVPEEVVDSLLK